MFPSDPNRFIQSNNNKEKSKSFIDFGSSMNTQATPTTETDLRTGLFICDLPPTITEEEQIVDAFSPYGEVVKVLLLLHKRIGIVEFAVPISAQRAYANKESIKLDDKAVRIQFKELRPNLY